MEKIHHPSSAENIPVQEHGPVEAVDPPEMEQPFEYKLLKGHLQPDGKTHVSDQELRMNYLTLTDSLVNTIVKGAETKNEETGEMERHPFSRLIFLDKSGRPLSHLVRNTWPIFARDIETGEVPPMPRFNFLNIDRQQWTTHVDPDGAGVVNINNVTPSVIQSLRSISLTAEGKEKVRESGLSEAVDDMPTILDDEHVLIIDETYSTGRTAKIAAALLGRAYPSAHFDTTHWMKESYYRNGVSFNTVPVWYKDGSKMGRGVNDRFADFSATDKLDRTLPENYYRTVGRWFLSAPHWFANPGAEDVRDKDYRQLLREFKELAVNPDVPVIPSLSRDEQGFDDRIIAYNYDIDPHSLSQDKKDELVKDVITEIMDIGKAAGHHFHN